ncbi:MAG: DUF4878 domain-containing protein [Azoarcus sp.]|nr:DUF4878 domain-containing protein [Azoarcus sp.]
MKFDAGVESLRAISHFSISGIFMSSSLPVQSRPLYVLFTLFLVTLLSACGSSPESVVEDYFDAVANNRIDKAISYCSLKSVGENDLTKGKLQMVVGVQHSQITQNGGIKSLKVTTTQEAEDHATVEVEIVFGNGQSNKDNLRLRKEGSAWKIQFR